ncbi:expressed unknown protein [Seminavis robusta]|uniref:Uncharacterized protein n=1 Tax=Seminavis robusta TaxID=568900 RepID=A0A9N8DEA3_9STRA|nr:expressed unknown protein [Seminavis robusta]|eukprot:Sro108_g054230.1 n/a (218) ;mRNA; r:70262-71021
MGGIGKLGYNVVSGTGKVAINVIVGTAKVATDVVAVGPGKPLSLDEPKKTGITTALIASHEVLQDPSDVVVGTGKLDKLRDDAKMVVLGEVSNVLEYDVCDEEIDGYEAARPSERPADVSIASIVLPSNVHRREPKVWHLVVDPDPRRFSWHCLLLSWNDYVWSLALSTIRLTILVAVRDDTTFEARHARQMVVVAFCSLILLCHGILIDSHQPAID